MDIQQVLSYYGMVLLEFLGELYVFYALVMHRLEKQKPFLLRVFLGLLGIAVLAFGIAFFYALFGNTVWGRVLVYVVLFILTTIHAKLCFKESYRIILFCCSMAYAVQNLVYKCYSFVWCLGDYFHLYDNWGWLFNVWYRLSYYSFFVLATVGSYFLFIRPLINKLSNRQLNRHMLTISLVVLVITVLLCSFNDVYFSKLSIGREYSFDNDIYYVLYETGNLFSVMSCSILLVLFSRTIEGNDLQQEVEYLQHAIRQSEQQYEITKNTIDLINVKCHDIKYKINALLLQKEELTQDAISDLNESISIYDSRIKTGNQLLDVLLTEKSLYCEQNGITFSCMVDGEKLAFINDGDLYCLFSNLIDNALEAVKGLEDREKRVVNLVVKAKNNLVLVQEENYYDGSLTFLDGLPVTTKEDKNYHGFGTKSIRMIVRKYGGEFSAYTKEDVFHLNLLFSQ